MARIREGHQPALLVVDVQVAVVEQAWQAANVVDRIDALVHRARAAGVPVIWVQHHDDELVRDTPAWQWAPPLAPAPGELRIDKQHNSSFEDTPLEQALAQQGITHLVLAGAATNWCIRATAYAALERGYDLTLVGDGHTTGSSTLEDGRVIEAGLLVEELNRAMTWLSYPGRRNRVRAADAIDWTEVPG